MTVAQLVSRERARLNAALAMRGAAIVMAVAALVAAVCTILLGEARWITRPTAPMAAWIITAGLSCVAIWWTGREMKRAASATTVAAAIERERELRDGSLRGALEVSSSGPLGRRAADDIAARLGKSGNVLAPLLHRRFRNRVAVTGAVLMVTLILLGAARRSAPDGWNAFKHPLGAWTGSLLPPLKITGVPRDVMRGERLKVQVSAAERRSVELRVRRTGMAWEAQRLDVRNGVAGTVIGPVDADMRLVAFDGRRTSDTVLVRVTDRPFVGDVAIRATYPGYLGRPSEPLAVGEPVRLPQGTMLSVQGRSSAALTRVALINGRDTLSLRPDGHRFSGRFGAARGKWTWIAASAQGAVADVPGPLEIDIVPDSGPRIEILSPARDTVVLANVELRILAAAMDDHGLASVSLRSWRQPASGGSALPEVHQLIASSAGQQWSGEILLDFAPRGLEPGDALHVVLAAVDNSPWRQVAQSRELVLRVPTLSEQRQIARAMADSTASQAAAAARTQQQLAQRTGEAARARGQRNANDASGANAREREQRDRAMSFESAERSRALAKEQERLQAQVRELERAARALQQQLKAAGALDSSLSRQLQEAAKLLRDALTPELQAQLEEVLKSSQQLSVSDSRQALENLARQQQRLREQLERSAEMLKRAAMEGAMETLKDEAEEIAARDRAVADSLGRGDSTAASDAKQLSERSRDLSEDIAELSRRMEKSRAESGPKRLQSAAKRAGQSAETMRKASEKQNKAENGSSDPQRGERQLSEQQERSEEAAREGADQMEQAADELAEAREKQVEEWKKELTGELDRSIQETLQLAREQQGLAQRAKAGKTDGLRADQSAVQQGVDKVGERLQKTAGKSSHISPQSQSAVGEAKRQVKQATDQVANSQRGGSEAENAMREATKALNKAAAALVKDRERVAGAASASGFAEMLQQMREMAKEQGSLNAQAAGLMPLPGGKPSASSSAEARSLGRQQRGLADQMDEIGQGEGGAGRAEQLAKEMRQIADELENGRLDPSVLERQQRLFRRMLDAGLSMEKEERDETGERESKSATGSEVLTPGGASSGRAATRFKEPTWVELRGLSAEERRAVLEYFRRINVANP